MSNLILPFGRPSTFRIPYSVRLRRSASAYAYYTPAAGGDRQKFTIVAFVKRANSDGDHTIFSVNAGSDFFSFVLRSTGQLRAIFEAAVNSYGEETPTSQLFFDPTAWNLYVLQVDTTQATASQRVRMWVWDTELTCDTISGYTQIPQNLNTYVNHTLQHEIGRFGYTAGSHMDGNFAHVRIISGQALPGTAFCQRDTKTGQPVPKKFTGTVGSRDRFYDFSDATSTTTLWHDKSGNGLHATPVNFSVASGADFDQSLDTPTNNHATLNPLAQNSTGVTLSAANLGVARNAASNGQVWSTIGMSSGKWRMQVRVTDELNFRCGISRGDMPGGDVYIGNNANSWGYQWTGTKITNSSPVAYGNTWTAGDVIDVLFDADAGKLYWAKNGTVQNGGNPDAGTGFAFDGLTNGPYFFSVSCENVATANSVNFGQQPWANTIANATQFKALCAANLPTPSILNPADAYSETPYSGNNSTQAIAQRFQADMIRQKCLNVGRGWRVQDAVRGFNNVMGTDGTHAQYAGSSILSVSASQIVLQNADNYNTTGENYVLQAWREGPQYGMDIVVYQGNGGTQTISHNLGATPHYIEVKPYLVGGYRWCVYHRAFGAARYGYLNENFAFDTANAINRWGNNSSTVEPTSSNFTIGNSSDVNANGVWYIAFVFTSIPGFSAFIGYQGNTSSLPFVNLGFKARTLTLKDCQSVASWRQWSLARQPQNGARYTIYPNTGGVHNLENFINITAMGFKILVTAGFGINDNGNTHLCNAFAEAPAKFATAV